MQESYFGVKQRNQEEEREGRLTPRKETTSTPYPATPPELVYCHRAQQLAQNGEEFVSISRGKQNSYQVFSCMRRTHLQRLRCKSKHVVSYTVTDSQVTRQ